METLRAYLKSLTNAERAAFARRCGTSDAYMRKLLYVGAKVGCDLAVSIDRESGGKVRFEVLRPDIDWSYVRRKFRSPAGAAA